MRRHPSFRIEEEEDPIYSETLPHFKGGGGGSWCPSPGQCCRGFGGLVITAFVYIYLVSYLFGESGTPRILWFTTVVLVILGIVALIYTVSLACMSCLGDWPLTIVACVSAFAIIGGLQIFINGDIQ